MSVAMNLGHAVDLDPKRPPAPLYGNSACAMSALIRGAFGLDIPKIIARNPNAVRREGEKISFGRFLAHDQKFPKLADDEYVFLIDRRRGVMYSPRMPDLTQVDELVTTHRSLEEAYFRKFGEKPEVVAAGEFFIDLGVVHTLNNKARTYLGNQTHLTYAETRLAEAGLDFKPNTFRKEYELGGFKDNHFEEIVEARAKRFLMLHRTLSKAVKKLFKFRQSIANRFPGERAGTVDWYDFFKSSNVKKYRYHPSEHRDKEAWITSNINAYLESHDSLFKELELAYQKFGEKGFNELVDQFPQMEGYYYRP